MNQRPAKALFAFQQALRLRPDSADLQLNTAIVLMRLNQREQAAGHLDQSLALDPDNPLAQSLSATLLMEAGDTTAARDQLQRIVTKYPAYYPALLYLGKAHVALKEYALAVAVLVRFIEVEPDSVDGATAYASALAHTEASTKAIFLLDSLAERFPNNLEILKAQQIASFRQRRFDQSRLINQRVNSIEWSNEQLNTAVGLLDRGESGEALATLEQLAKAQPSLYQARLLQFRELALQRNFSAAEEVARELQQRLPDSALPPLLLGIALAGQGDDQTAQQQLDIAWQRAPGHPAIAARLAVLALSHGDTAKAADYYRQVLEQHPGHGATLKQLAMLASQRDDQQQRLAYLQQYVSYHPLELKPRLLLAASLYTQGQPQAAIEVLHKTKQADSNNPDYLALLTELEMTDQPEAALQTAGKLLQLQPASAYAQLLVAEAQARTDGANAELYQLMQAAIVLDGNGGLVALRLDPQRVDDALALARNMGERYPETGIWVELQAQLLLRGGDIVAATRLIQRWRNQHPRSPIPDTFAAGIALARQDQPQAVRLYREALRKAPDNVTALNNLAWLMLDDDPAAALRLARRAADISTSAEILDTLGIALTANDQPGRAVTILRIAGVKDPASTEKRLHLAQAYAAAGDEQAAARLLGAMLQSEQAFAERVPAQLLLDRLTTAAPAVTTDTTSNTTGSP